jgi:hypothetical protein
MSRYIDAAAVLLLEHYDLEEAKYRAHVLDARTSQSPVDVVVLACTMSLEDEPWWDSDDPKVRAIRQLSINTLLLPTVEELVADTEAGLGRELPGDHIEEKMGRLAQEVPRYLAELKGEEFVDPLQELMVQLRDMDIGALDDSTQDVMEIVGD